MLTLRITGAVFAAVLPLIAAVPLAENGHVTAPTAVYRRDPDATSTGSLTGSLAATARAGGEYISPIQVGGQTFNVLLDTGSSDLWIKGDAARHLSDTESTPGTFTIHYGSGTVSGSISKGPVTVGGLRLSSLSFGIADHWVSAYDSYDGILGIASRPTQFDGNAQTDSWIAEVAPQLASPVVGVDFKGGEITLGYEKIPQGYGLLNWVNIDAGSPHWDLQVQAQNGGGNAVCDFDTGTTLMMAPRSLVSGYWAGIAGAKEDGSYYSYPCDTQLPDMKFEIGGIEYAVPESSIRVGNNGDICQGQPKVVADSDGCIMGQGFLNNVYVVYDYGNKTVGFSRPL